jgi:hypothetical protein
MRRVLQRQKQADRRASARNQHELTAHLIQVIGISAQLFVRHEALVCLQVQVLPEKWRAATLSIES